MLPDKIDCVTDEMDDFKLNRLLHEKIDYFTRRSSKVKYFMRISILQQKVDNLAR